MNRKDLSANKLRGLFDSWGTRRQAGYGIPKALGLRRVQGRALVSPKERPCEAAGGSPYFKN